VLLARRLVHREDQCNQKRPATVSVRRPVKRGDGPKLRPAG
jgi:hypothetical protein